jgi:hypothetical protein
MKTDIFSPHPLYAKKKVQSLKFFYSNTSKQYSKANIHEFMYLKTVNGSAEYAK